jgi:hypothetical protein
VDTTVKAPTPTVTQADITTSTAASTTPIFDLRSCSNMDNEQGAAAFDEELTEYFRDASECEDCLNATTAEVSPWPQQLPQCLRTFPNLMEVADLALSKSGAQPCGRDMCVLCDGVDGGCFDGALIVDMYTWDTSAITSFKGAFRKMKAFNQVSSALHACS